MTDISPWYGFLLGALATWRIAHLLQFEDGPWRLLARTRRSLTPWLGGVLACFYCFSVWIALPAALLLGHTWPERFWLWPALSGAAILLERVISPAPPPTPWYVEDSPKDNPHELLRPVESQSPSAPDHTPNP